MTTKYFALLTTTGAALLANATALGKQLSITQMALGDGGGTLPTPDAAQTKLVNERRRAPLNSLSVDTTNTNQIIAEQVIPEDEGGWWIREIGLYDAAGNLIAVANCPETYKPLLQEGSGRVQTVRMILIVSSTDAVTLKIDPSVVLATRKYVDDSAIVVKAYADDAMAKHLADANPHKQYAPLASPALTGTPTAPTAAAGASTTQLATTAFVSTATANHVAAANPHPQYAPLASPEFTGRVKVTADGAGAVLLKAATANAAVGISFQTNLGVQIAQLTYAGTNTQFYSYLGGNSVALIDSGDITIAPKAGQSLKITTPVTVNGDGNQILLQQSTKAPSSGSYIKGLNSDGVFLWTVGRSESNGWLELGGKGSNRIALADSGDVTIAPGTGKTTKITSTATLTAPAAGDNSTSAITSGWFAAEIAGIPLPWPQATAPTGWLKCNGQSFDKTLYPKLTAAYPSGTLPDLRGEFIRGWDDGRGVDSGRAVLSVQDATWIQPNIESNTAATTIRIDNVDSTFNTDEYSAVSNLPSYEHNGSRARSYVRPRNVAFNYIVRAA
ncbi:phage tail-collar fiber domain-containing protein [Musicola paradisiaca]|uniref:Tail Collar domain protein n=1 Tax=Musicola paradisiaca (strain Ech703) TaxID=579405 RepID=C6C5D4_MUSP7|nr:phage tail protein [Musicola paradisiaca]ACS87571.1 Tail Collar domain protein [Musicola paradisiaca Ech703]